METEINGFLTYGRCVEKLEAEALWRAHAGLISLAARYKTAP